MFDDDIKTCSICGSNWNNYPPGRCNCGANRGNCWSTGPTGPTWPTLPTGPTGPTGSSAFQIAVQNGFFGTEEQWLTTLIGATGATGPAGIDGQTPVFSVGGNGTNAPVTLGDSVTFRSPDGSVNIDITAGSAIIDLTASGTVGPTGATGLQGQAGPIGPQGLQGIQGPMGPQGDQGIQGPAGSIGPQGPQGIQGITGEQGPAGFDGFDGIQGDPGPTGTAELASYGSYATNAVQTIAAGAQINLNLPLIDNSGMDFTAGAPTVTVGNTGAYRIGYSISTTAGNTAVVSLMQDGAAIPGSGITLTTDTSNVSGTVIVTLTEATAISLGVTVAPITLAAAGGAFLDIIQIA